MVRTDTDRLDAIANMATNYGNGWVLSYQDNVHGLCLRQSAHPDAELDIRKAIDKFLKDRYGSY